MKDSEIDRILSRRDEILPSSGFVTSVMDAVRREAAAPPPIPFPWKRALPGLALGVLALAVILGAGVVVVARGIRGPFSAEIPIWPSLSTSTALAQGNFASAAGWTCLALLLAWASVKLSMRLAAGRT
jgi:hypothetical protein